MLSKYVEKRIHMCICRQIEFLILFVVLSFLPVATAQTVDSSSARELIAILQLNKSLPSDASPEAIAYIRRVRDATKSFLSHDKNKSIRPEAALFLKTHLNKMNRYLKLVEDLSQCRAIEGDKRKIADKVLAGALVVDPCELYSTKIRNHQWDDISDLSLVLQQGGGGVSSLDMSNFIRESHKQSVLDTLTSSWTLSHTFSPQDNPFECQGLSIYQKFKSIAGDINQHCARFKSVLANDARFSRENQKFPRYRTKNKVAFQKMADELNKSVAKINSQVKTIANKKYQKIEDVYQDYNKYSEAFEAMSSTNLGRLVFTRTLSQKVGMLQNIEDTEFEDGKLKLQPHLKDGRAITAQDIQVANREASSAIMGQLNSLSEMNPNEPKNLKELLKKHPLAVGQVLLKNPSFAKDICTQITDIASSDKTNKMLLDAFEWATFAIGVIPIGGWAVAGVGSLLKMAATRAAGRVVASSVLANAVGSGMGLASVGLAEGNVLMAQNYLREARDLQFKVFNKPEYKQFSGELRPLMNELDDAIFNAQLSGALSVVDAASLMRGLAQLHPSALAGELRSRIAHLKSLSTQDLVAKLKTKYPELTDEQLALAQKYFKEDGSIQHQVDMLAANENPDIAALTKELGIDWRLTAHGIVDSDAGKLDAFWNRAVSPSDLKESDHFFEALQLKGNSRAAQGLRELASEKFGGKPFFNPDLSTDTLRQTIRDNKMLQGFLHEYPGLLDAMKDVNSGKLTVKEFKARVAANLTHNGPQAGFWKFFTENLVPGSLKDSDVGRKFFDNTIYDVGRNPQTGGTNVAYPTATGSAVKVHIALDRLSQATRGGVMKIVPELLGPQYIVDPGVAAGKVNGLGWIKEMLTKNQSGTLAQIDELQRITLVDETISESGRQKLDRFYKAIEGRVQKLQAYNAQGFSEVKTAEGPALRLVYVTEEGVKVAREIRAETPMVEALDWTNEFLKAEERLNGDPIQDLQIDQIVN